MNNYFNKIKELCTMSSKKREIELIDNKIGSLQKQRNEILGNNASKNEVKKTSDQKTKNDVTMTKDELIINVAANIQVKDICRNIERKLKRNLQKNNKDDWQLLYNHLYYFYLIKHQSTLPIVHGKNKDYHINDYVAYRATSVINDVTCHINFK
jgi:hypothetical protein